MNNLHRHQGTNPQSKYQYVDIGRIWNSKLKEIFESDEVQHQLFRDFNSYLQTRSRLFQLKGSYSSPPLKYLMTDRPIRFDPSDWRRYRVGRPYSFDEYVCYGACHWIVNSLLIAAKIAFPNKPWIIVKGRAHSTVWDQADTFFDMNYFALKVSPDDCARNTIFDGDTVFFGENELVGFE